ncbi:MAG: sugar ABC transporter permease [Provencibacterium sp.]|jgi:putative aldouronate transport system permease protein|nr:sugar ABC transporter permease [Provencibacterium sp.]
MSFPKTAASPAAPAQQSKSNLQKTLKLMKRNYILYLFLLPAAVYLVLYHYAPMYGIQLAFKDYIPAKGIWGSPWVGMKWFNTFFSSPRFWVLLKNTVVISLYSLAASFPTPVILALIINNVGNNKLRRFSQTVTYIPHFISVVVLVGMISVFFSPRSGFVNTIIQFFGAEPIYFMGEPQYFRHMYVWSGVWQSTGWGSIIYLAALAGVGPELHEAAIIDGASRLKRIWHIDLPAIMPTMVILLIMNCGQVMNVGFEKIYLMQNSLNQVYSEVISTYTYKIGLLQAEYSYSTAIGLFNNVINFIILIAVNKIAGKLSGSSLW